MNINYKQNADHNKAIAHHKFHPGTPYMKNSFSLVTHHHLGQGATNIMQQGC